MKRRGGGICGGILRALAALVHGLAGSSAGARGRPRRAHLHAVRSARLYARGADPAVQRLGGRLSVTIRRGDGAVRVSAIYWRCG